MTALSFIIFAVFLLLAISTSVSGVKASDILRLPESCKGHRFCTEKLKGYDDKYVKRMKKALPQFLLQARSESGSECGVTPAINKDCCPYTVKCERVYAFNPIDDPTVLDIIIQLDDIYEQYIPSVTCIHNNTRSNVDCFSGLLPAVHNKVSKCVTSTSKRNLYTYDEENEKVIVKTYEVPSCCYCSISDST